MIRKMTKTKEGIIGLPHVYSIAKIQNIKKLD